MPFFRRLCYEIEISVSRRLSSSVRFCLHCTSTQEGAILGTFVTCAGHDLIYIMSASDEKMSVEELAGVEKMRESFPVGMASAAGLVLDDACLLRYLRARNGSVAKATSMLTATLEWRREFDVEKARKGAWKPLSLFYGGRGSM